MKLPAGMHINRGTLIGGLIFLALASNLFGQERCFSAAESQKLVEAIKNKQLATVDKKVRKELIELSEERQKLVAKIATDLEKNKELIPEVNKLGETHLAQVCRILRENGWPTNESLKEDGLAAFTSLLTTSRSFNLQKELLPVLVQAAKSDLLGFPLIASMVDSIRLQAGLPQIFGTQATIRDNVVYIYPLLNDEKVDDWRKEYKLPPMASQIRRLEAQYMLPVLRSQRRSSQADDQAAATTLLGISPDENEAIKVLTKVVNLNVRVLTQSANIPAAIRLSKADFRVFEDGVEQDVTFFNTTEEPFDLVLVLDFSGSTVEKRGLIKKAARRFVDYARPGDRIAVVAFATEINLVAPLTPDKSLLKNSIDFIKLEGSSPIWEALRFVYGSILKTESAGKRSAVVIMTDGLDNSKTMTFSDAMETVRHGDTTVFSIYLNTGIFLERVSDRSKAMLSMLADETGGQMYAAKGIHDLNGIYEQIITDLGKVFTIGYEPKNDRLDGGWREILVKTRSQLNLPVKARRGYYAN